MKTKINKNNKSNSKSNANQPFFSKTREKENLFFNSQTKSLQPPPLFFQPKLTTGQPNHKTNSQKIIQRSTISRDDKSIGGLTEQSSRTKEVSARRDTLNQKLKNSLQKNIEGEIYFKGVGKCIIRKNKIKKGKKEIGKIEHKIENKKNKLLYSYNDKDNKKYEGDLLIDNFGATHEEKINYNEYNKQQKTFETPKEETFTSLSGEGSYLKLKNGDELVFGPGGWIILQKKKSGYAKYGGGKTLEALVEMFSPQDFTFEELKEFDYMSQVETSGMLQGINSYDSEKMSLGFTQFTMAGKIQKWYEKAEELYGTDNPFKKYGIDKLLKPGKKADFKKYGKQFQSRFWAARFYEAGLDKKMIKSQMVVYKEIEKKKYQKLKDNNIENEAVKAMLLELSNNRPVFFNIAIDGIKDRTILSGKDEAQTFDKKKLKTLLGEIYKYFEPFVGRNLSASMKRLTDEINDKKYLLITLFDNLNNNEKNDLSVTLSKKKDRNSLIDSKNTLTVDEKRILKRLLNKQTYRKLLLSGIADLKNKLKTTKAHKDAVSDLGNDKVKGLKNKLGISKVYNFKNIKIIKLKINADDTIKNVYNGFWRTRKHEAKGHNIYDKINKRAKQNFSGLEKKFNDKSPKTTDMT